MNSKIVIRSETPDDIGAITEVTKGIGKKLIDEGLSRLKHLNARGCCLVGHPEYYRKVGFTNTPGLVHEGVPPEVFFTLPFDGHIPEGTLTFHEGFKADGQQGGGYSPPAARPSKPTP